MTGGAALQVVTFTGSDNPTSRTPNPQSRPTIFALIASVSAASVPEVVASLILAKVVKLISAVVLATIVNCQGKY